MQFPENYSDYIYERSSSGIMLDNSTISGSTISFKMDASSKLHSFCEFFVMRIMHIHT